MKKLIMFLFLVFPTMTFAGNELYVFNFSEYMPDWIITEFHRETRIKIIHASYDSNEAMYAKIKILRGRGYDIVVPSTFYVDRMSKEGLLQPLDKSRILNFKNIDPMMLNKAADPENNYSVPYLWGTTGLCVNSEKVNPNTVKSWKDLWKPEFKGKVLLIDDIREVFGMGLKVLGYSINDTDPKHIEEAYQKLKLLIPSIRVFTAEMLIQPFLNQDVVIGMNWNGDVFRSSKENPKIKFIQPEEGLMVWVDSMAIPKEAKNIDNAYKFIDFMLRPENAKRLCEETGYSTPNKEAIKLMKPEIQENKTIFPDPAILQKSEFFSDVGSAVVEYQRYWEKLKTGN